MKKHLVILIFFFNLPFADIAYGQFTYGTTGLLHMPTADMHRDKTVMAGVSYLYVAATPDEWNYNTCTSLGLTCVSTYPKIRSETSY